MVVSDIIFPVEHPSQQRQHRDHTSYARVYRTNDEIRRKDGGVPTLNSNLNREIPRYDAVHRHKYREN